MKKLLINVSLKSNSNTINIKTTGYLNEKENYIIYKELDENNTITKYYFRENKLDRENNNMKLIYYFDILKSTNGNVFIKDINQTLIMNIKTKKIESNDRHILIKYCLNDEDYTYEITRVMK